MTTITKTTRRLFATWANIDQAAPLLIKLASYAAQRPGLDFRDYGDVSAYRSDARKITRQFAACGGAIQQAYALEVTDGDLIEATRGDRLTIIDGAVDYVTGQYWPTEYRAAVARVVNRACRIAAARQA
jgi:hypothetical protein